MKKILIILIALSLVGIVYAIPPSPPTTGGTPATADISDVGVIQTELAELETIDATTISAAQWAGLGASLTFGISVMAAADEAAFQALVTVPWADAYVADDITASSYLPLAGGTLTAEVTVDELGLEFQETDTAGLTDCTNFSATGGGIFYDDSEGIFKKCQEGLLTDLDTSSATATADIVDVTVTATELEELATIGDTIITAAQWAALGGSTAAGYALWDDANAAAQLITLGLTADAAELNLLDGETDIASQAELNAVAALVDTDDEIIAIVNASPATQISVAAGGTNSGTALANDFVMVSSGGAVIESATVTATELGLLNGETDLASQAELNAVAALVDTDDEIIAIINASPATYVDVAAGGTGVGTFALNGVLYGNGTTDVKVTAIGAAGDVLVAGADPFVPVWDSSPAIDCTDCTLFTATDAAQGAVELATDGSGGETQLGTATDRAVTPNGLTDMLAEPMPIGSTTPNTGNFTTITAGAAGFGVDATGDTTVASLIMPVTQDPLWWFNTTHASDTDWWIGTNADGTGDDNDAWEIRRSATPGTSVDFRALYHNSLSTFITQDYEELQIPVTAWTTDNAVGDGKFYFRIGHKLAGLNLIYVHAEVITAGTATAAELLTITIYNVTQAADILSTAITLDSTETGSDTADAAAVIDAAQDDMSINDVIQINIDEIFATTASKGLIITLGFDIP